MTRAVENFWDLHERNTTFYTGNIKWIKFNLTPGMGAGRGLQKSKDPAAPRTLPSVRPHRPETANPDRKIRSIREGKTKSSPRLHPGIGDPGCSFLEGLGALHTEDRATQLGCKDNQDFSRQKRAWGVGGRSWHKGQEVLAIKPGIQIIAKNHFNYIFWHFKSKPLRVKMTLANSLHCWFHFSRYELKHTSQSSECI